MNRTRLPVPLVVIACLYLAVGVVGFVYHFHDLLVGQQDAIWVELTEFLAIICGVFLLRRHNWARWLAVAWMAFHVAISAFHPLPRFFIHSLFFIAIVWALFASASARVFQPDANQPQ